MNYIFTEKASWFSAVKNCKSQGPGWTLPALDNKSEIADINKVMKKKKSVWTGIKRVTFDAYYWEDGSFGGKFNIINNCMSHVFVKK